MAGIRGRRGAPKEKEDPIFNIWDVLKKQWGMLDVKLRVTLRGGDPNSLGSASSDTITLNKARIRKAAKQTGLGVADLMENTLRHEMAHVRTFKFSPEAPAHGEFQHRMERALGFPTRKVRPTGRGIEQGPVGLPVSSDIKKRLTVKKARTPHKDRLGDILRAMKGV